jgi:O-antigen chain-terminating methyltransferase
MNFPAPPNGEMIMDKIKQKVRVRKSAVFGQSPDPYIDQHLFDVDEFYKYEDEEFICKAYLGILGRKADKEGLQGKLKELTDFNRTKKELLLDIILSEEAKQKKKYILRLNKPDENALQKANLAFQSWLGEKISFNSTELKNDPEIISKPNFTIADFTKYNDESFIDNAYKQILGRKPDLIGKKTNLDLLRSGNSSKIGILCNLCYSKEGKKNEINIQGLKKHYIYRAISNIPIAGYLLRTASALIKLPHLLNHINKLESDCNRLTDENKILLARTNILKQVVIENSKIIDFKANDIDIKLLYQLIRETEIKADSITLTKNANQIELELNQLIQQTRDHKLNILDTQHQLKLLREKVKNDQPEPSSEIKIKNIVEDDHLLDAMYVAFEDKFRGSKEEIKERLIEYLPYVQEARRKTQNAPVLDVGTGRGEWLSLMKENDIEAKGLDLNHIMVTLCQESGLDAIESDVIEYLKKQNSNSLSVITGFHIIEHLPFKVLINLYDEAYRVLKPGGIVIFETPNPENLIVGACNFYTDPTHINPIPPETAKFFLEARNFSNVEINRLRLNKDPSLLNYESPLTGFFTNYVDYSVIGYKI